MAKVKKEAEEINISVVKTKPSTVITRWFADYAVNNTDELRIVSELTARSAEEQFHMYSATENTEVYAAIFYATFLSILEFIRGKQIQYNNFTVSICNSINIGYSNNDDEDNEKVGNFMPIMEHIGINQNIIDDSTSGYSADKTSQNFIRWKELNIRQTIEYYKEMQENAYEKLKKEYGLNLRTSEAVIPLFCIFMDHISNLMKNKYREAEGTGVSEVSMNVLGLFDVFYTYNEDDACDVIEYQPNIMMKLALKSDTIANRE